MDSLERYHLELTSRLIQLRRVIRRKKRECSRLEKKCVRKEQWLDEILGKIRERRILNRENIREVHRTERRQSGLGPFPEPIIKSDEDSDPRHEKGYTRSWDPWLGAYIADDIDESDPESIMDEIEREMDPETRKQRALLEQREE